MSRIRLLEWHGSYLCNYLFKSNLGTQLSFSLHFPLNKIRREKNDSFVATHLHVR